MAKLCVFLSRVGESAAAESRACVFTAKSCVPNRSHHNVVTMVTMKLALMKVFTASLTVKSEVYREAFIARHVLIEDKINSPKICSVTNLS